MVLLLFMRQCHKLLLLCGLLQACATSTELLTTENGKCEGIDWSTSPLAVITQDVKYADVLAKAMVFWYPCFAVATSFPEVFVFEWDKPDLALTTVPTTPECAPRMAFVALPDDPPLRMVAHELGHVLGLAHDPEDPRSVMFPYIYGRVESNDPATFDVQDVDIEMVQRVCPEFQGPTK